MPNTSHQKFVMTQNHQGLQRSPMSFSSTQRAGFQALAPKDFVTYLEKLPEAEPFPDVFMMAVSPATSFQVIGHPEVEFNEDYRVLWLFPSADGIMMFQQRIQWIWALGLS